MPGAYNITTRVDGETLTAAKYNADHQSHIDHMEPVYVDDYSASLSQMRSQTDPGESGSEVLATTLAAELERIRYRLAEISGMTYWYQTGTGVRAQSIAAASLPVAGVAGKLVYQNDSDRGLFVDTGTGWVTATPFFDVSGYGAKGDGTTDDTTAITNALSAAGTMGGTVYFPAGTYLTSGLLAIPAYVGLLGVGMQRSIIKSSSNSNAVFTMLTGSESSVEAGMNFISNLTVRGTGKGQTGKAFDIKNKTNITFMHIEVYDFQYAFQGRRDHTANSCTHLTWIGCRVRETKYGISGIRQWNNCNVFGGQWAADVAPFILYDCSGFNIYGASGNFGMADTGGTGVFLGGCDGCVISGFYAEGDPQTEAFIIITKNKDNAGNTSNNGINLNNGRSNVVEGVRASSAGGTNYVVLLDGAENNVVTGINAGSGIGTAAVRLTTNCFGNVMTGIRANSGVTTSYQTANDALVNFELDTDNGGAGAMPRIINTRILELRQGSGASSPSRAVLGNAGATFSDFASDGITVGMSGDTAHISVDGSRNNDDAALSINFRGYSGGTTKFRDFIVYDGKGNIVLQIDPSLDICIINAANIKFTNLPTSAGASKTLWYDTGAANVVKFVP